MNRTFTNYLLKPCMNMAIAALISVCTLIFAMLLLVEEVQSVSDKA